MKTYDPRRFVRGLLPLLMMLLLATSLLGCGKNKIENPYEPASLAQAVSGPSQNKLFKFELSDPEVLAVETRLALLAAEDRIEFLVADDLSLLATLDSGYKLGVRRAWGMNPEVYLILEHVIEGPDTSFMTSDEPPVFPSYQNEAAFDRSPYADIAGEMRNMGRSERSSLLRAYGREGSKVRIAGRLTRSEAATGQMSYNLESDMGKFKLDGVNALGEIFLKAVLATGGETTVFGPLGELYRRNQQEESGVMGPMTLEHFVFQNYVITNG